MKTPLRSNESSEGSNETPKKTERPLSRRSLGATMKTPSPSQISQVSDKNLKQGSLPNLLSPKDKAAPEAAEASFSVLSKRYTLGPKRIPSFRRGKVNDGNVDHRANLTRSHSIVLGRSSSNAEPVRGQLGRTASMNVEPVRGQLARTASINVEPVRGQLGRTASMNVEPVRGQLGRTASMNVEPVRGQLRRTASINVEPVRGQLRRTSSISRGTPNRCMPARSSSFQVRGERKTSTMLPRTPEVLEQSSRDARSQSFYRSSSFRSSNHRKQSEGTAKVKSKETEVHESQPEAPRRRVSRGSSMKGSHHRKPKRRASKQDD
jgi:hypothetical protein